MTPAPKTALACDSGASVSEEEGRPLTIRRLVSAPSLTIQASSLARFLLFKAAAALVTNISSQSEENHHITSLKFQQP